MGVGGIGREHEVEDDDHKYQGMGVVTCRSKLDRTTPWKLRSHTEKGSPQSAQDHVYTYAQRNQKYSGVDIHASEGSDDCTATKQELASNQDIGKESKKDEDPMGECTITRVYNFQICVTHWSILLNFASQDREHEYLHSRTSSVLEEVSTLRAKNTSTEGRSPRKVRPHHIHKQRCLTAAESLPTSKLIQCHWQSTLA